jgi:hypothetical protein
VIGSEQCALYKARLEDGFTDDVLGRYVSYSTRRQSVALMHMLARGLDYVTLNIIIRRELQLLRTGWMHFEASIWAMPSTPGTTLAQGRLHRGQSRCFGHVMFNISTAPSLGSRLTQKSSTDCKRELGHMG